jgi:uncharacterized FlaG/YvyC family protein
MSETSITPISSVQPADSGLPARLLAVTTEVVKVNKPESPSQETRPKEVGSESTLADNLSNVSIYFRTDNKTSEVTIFVVDRDSKRVLRSIPASELQKLQAGDLLKLTA